MARGTESDGFRPDIEGLRGIAVLLVVIFHAGLLSSAAVQLRGGFIGVDLFFVVSGYLITGLLVRERERTGRVSFARFYARRVRRILPAAAVVLLVTLPAAYGLVALVDRGPVMQDGAAAALSVANVRFALTTDYFNPVSYSPFLHFWSLGVEEQFYFVWPAVLAIVAWRRPRAGAAVALAAIIGASFAASLLITDSSPSTAFYMLPTRAWQLAAGGLLAVVTPGAIRLPRPVRLALGALLAAAGWVALAALALAALAFDSATVPYPGSAALVPTLAGIALIASGLERSGPGALLRLAPVRFLGRISYSLYLWHWPLLILGGLYLGGSMSAAPADGGVATGLLTPVQAVALVALSIGVATLSWALVEEPFRRARIPLPSRPTHTVAIGVSIMLIVAIVGGSLDFTARTALAGLTGPGSVAAAEPAASPLALPTVTASPATPVPSGRPRPSAAQSAAPSAPSGPVPTPVPTPRPATAFALTSSVRPALGAARNDVESVWNQNCVGWTQTLVPRNCVYGNPNGTVTVAFLGDSHASALFPAVEAVARARGWRLEVFFKIACSVLDMRISNPELKREYTECATWNANVVARLRANPPDLTIVTESRWIYPELDAQNSISAEGAAYGREIAKLPGPVAIVSDIPLPGIDVPACLSSNTGDVRKCAVARSRAFGSGMGQREAIAAKMTGAKVVELTAYVCPGSGACPVVIGNMIAFRDTHHLTATFSRSLGPALDQRLAAAGFTR